MTFDTSPVPVPVGRCRCPGEPHGGGDIVYLHPQVSMRGGMSIKAALVSQITDPIEAQQILARAYFGEIESWTMTDDEGDPVAINQATIDRLLPWARGGREVAEKADDLYIADVANPFVAQLQKLNQQQRKRSAPGPTSSTATSETPNSPTSSPPVSIRSRRKSS